MWILIVSLRVPCNDGNLHVLKGPALHFLREYNCDFQSNSNSRRRFLRSIIDSLLAIEKTSEFTIFGDLSDEKTHREVRG